MQGVKVFSIHDRVNLQRVFHKDPHAIQRVTDCFVQILPSKPAMLSRETHRLYAGNDPVRLMIYEPWMRPEIVGILCVRTENVTGGLIHLTALSGGTSMSRQLRAGDMMVWDIQKYKFRMSTLEAYMPGEGETYADFITYFSQSNMSEQRRMNQLD